jgi:hypothetical protein
VLEDPVVQQIAHHTHRHRTTTLFNRERENRGSEQGEGKQSIAVRQEGVLSHDGCDTLG